MWHPLRGEPAKDPLPRLGWGERHLNVGIDKDLDRGRHEVGEVLADQSKTARRAVFLDRDGTLIEHVHYLTDPARVRLLPGVVEALKKLQRAGFARVLVTNQSAIGRGMLSEARLDEIHAELNRQLAAQGATIDAIYYCPEAPVGDDPTVVANPDRKPGPGMLLRAAADLKLDLGASWMVGDLMSDVKAGLNAGCRSILVLSGQTTAADAEKFADQTPIVPDLSAALDLILAAKEEEQ